MSDTELRPAVFLDRDGVLNEEVGYVNHPSRYQVYSWTPEAVRALNDAGFATVVLTNQAGVARGYFDEAFVAVLHKKLRDEIAKGGGHLDAIYYCPHHPEGKRPEYKRACDCRKPGTGMIEQAVRELHIDLQKSYMVGDRFLDIDMARRAGIRAVFVLSGYGLGEYEYQHDTWPFQPWRVERDVLAAVRVILEDAKR